MSSTISATVDAIRAEIALRKEKRLAYTHVAGQSLGESLVFHTAGSARKWVERSRKLSLNEQRYALQTEAIAQPYTSDALTGMKVDHRAVDFVQGGEEVILTLKDSCLLTGVADDLNDDEEDELFNS
jgi:hypothetical protein